MTAIGSVCTGYGGLDGAAQSVIGGELAWVADPDPGAAAILAHHFPSVPNLGDITAVDWSAVEPVDVLTAGFPCQDISCAGRRAGLREGNRSGLWFHVARAIKALRPPLVVIENVKELLSERADSDMEPCPWCMGDTDPESAMRALGAVLADLAQIGFDAEWVSVPAASAGACHLRWRVFILAWPAADAERDGLQGNRPAAGTGKGRPAAASIGCRPADSGLTAENADRATGGERRQPAPGQAEGGRSWTDAGRPGGARTLADTRGAGLEIRAVEPHRDERPAAERGRGDAPDGPEWATAAAWRRPGAFGRYEAAVRRQEHAFGRLAPAPVEAGRNGSPRLSPVFTEWMMGLPEGWVTDVPGLSRNAQLKALGNGVVPQQAVLALRLLLDRAGIVTEAGEAA